MTSGRLGLLPEFAGSFEFNNIEENILNFWNEKDVFKTSLKKSEGKPRYSFNDGPPFATGLPHYGHILAGTIKDIVCRYAHQTGHHVERRFGWDCHGLPIEFEIDKALGIKTSQDVQKFGIANYNNECRKIVMRYSKEWETIVSRMGRWIDFKDGYRTMDINFMETVWWVFSQLWQQKKVYRGYKVMPFSTSCTTPLSNFEAGSNYKDVSDPAATVSFPLVDDPSVSFLAWTTTPWTLPSNLALVVNPEFDYITVEDRKNPGSHKYIFAECRLGELYKNSEKLSEDQKPFVILSRCKGKNLVGKSYKPLFNYFSGDKFFQIIADNYVTSDSGTGIVHSAPGFGEDDYRVCLENGVIDKGETVCPVDENGNYTSAVKDFVGRYVKDCDNDILAKIKAEGRLFQKAAIVHSYPFCWRSDTPLIYKAVSSWFVRVEEMRDQLLACNEQTLWVPEFVKTKRFTNWLQDAKDWNISRNRYFGTPLPIWHSADWEELVCVGSIKELEELSGVSGIKDLHREFVDEIEIPSKRPGMPPLKRVSEVFDCWFESGSMPYAQKHYPFENKEVFEQEFPPDFIAEGLDQTRGWFYTLMILSTALYNKPAFKNLIVNGLVLASDGKKMSKRLKNYPEVMTVVNKYGADALRLYLINSPVVRAEPLRFREEGVRDIIKEVFLPLMNACKYFVSNTNIFLLENPDESLNLALESSNEMDRWIISVGQTLVNYIHCEMKAYRLYNVVPGVVKYIDTLTNWYVRMNRRRMRGNLGKQERKESLCTLFRAIFTVSRTLSPFCPFLAEEIYQHIRCALPEGFSKEDSIHYIMLEDPKEKSKEELALEKVMERMIQVIELVRVLRDRVGIPMKMPVKKVIILHPDPEYIKDINLTLNNILTEINAFEVEASSAESDYVDVRLDANMASVGKQYKKESGIIKKALMNLSQDEIEKFLKTGTINVCGKELTNNEINIIRTNKANIKDYESNTDGCVVVLVDKRKDASLLDAWRAREFNNRVMQLRKSTGLQANDEVEVYYQSADKVLIDSLIARTEQIKETIKGKWEAVESIEIAGREKIGDVETTIDESIIKIALYRK